MSYGIEVRNSTGSLQIDSTYQNMVVLGRGTTSGYYDTQYCGNRIATVAFDFSGFSEAIIAVRPKNGDGIYRAFPDFNNNQFVINFGNTNYDNTSSSVDYIIYGLASQKTVNSAYGLKIFDSQGTKVFDSGLEYLKITDVLTFNLPSGGSDYSASTTTLPIPSGKVGLYLLSPTGLCTSSAVGGGYRVYTSSFVSFTSDNKVQINNASVTESDNFKIFLVEDPGV